MISLQLIHTFGPVAIDWLSWMFILADGHVFDTWFLECFLSLGWFCNVAALQWNTSKKWKVEIWKQHQMINDIFFIKDFWLLNNFSHHPPSSSDFYSLKAEYHQILFYCFQATLAVTLWNSKSNFIMSWSCMWWELGLED